MHIKMKFVIGFITIKGGHRIGITGTTVIENGKIIYIKDISSLNFRIAKEIIGVSKNLLQYIIDAQNDRIYNTLLVGMPGSGKTTMLRDIIRTISNGILNNNLQGKKVGLVDERGEIAAVYNGTPQNDVGMRTDIMNNCSKSLGLTMLIRTMSPEIVTTDEIGGEEDFTAIEYAASLGINGIFTIHGNNLEQMMINKNIRKIVQSNIFERIIFLDKNEKGKINDIYALEDGKYNIINK